MRFLALVFCALITSSCASAPAGPPESLGRAELLTADATYVYEALQTLRPRWLRSTVDAPEMGIAVRRSRGAPPPPISSNQRACLIMAYVDDVGARADDLRRLTVIRVAEVRLLPPRTLRPDGSRCTHDRPALHVVLLPTG